MDAKKGKKPGNLRTEHDRLGKVNKLVDRRIGEKDSTISDAEKSSLRSTGERGKSLKTSNKFNLADVPNDELSQEVLTHGGKTLTDVQKYDKTLISGDEDDGPGSLGPALVQQVLFGGGENVVGKTNRQPSTSAVKVEGSSGALKKAEENDDGIVRAAKRRRLAITSRVSPTPSSLPSTPKSVVSRRIEKVILSDFTNAVVKAQKGTVHFVLPYPDILPSELLLKKLNGRAKKEVTHSPSNTLQSDVYENHQRNTTKSKGARANTQMVITNLSHSFGKRQSPMTGSPLVYHGPYDSVILPQHTSTSRSNISSANSLGEDRILKSSRPMSVGIYLCSEKYADELMVIWSVSLEEDLVQAVSEEPNKSILCIEHISMMDMFNMTTKEKELLNKSQQITFTMLDDKKLCNQWTLISFGTIPIGLKDRLFTRFADVEVIFEDHARKNGKTLNNVMRCDGLFPLLSQHLQKKITGFNQ